MIQQIFSKEKNKHINEQITMSDYKDERGKAVAPRREKKTGGAAWSKAWQTEGSNNNVERGL